MQKMKLGELRAMYLNPDEVVKVYKGNSLVYKGYSFMIPDGLREDTVEEMRLGKEVRRKDWEETAQWEPLDDGETFKLKLTDAEICMFYRIQI